MYVNANCAAEESMCDSNLLGLDYFVARTVVNSGEHSDLTDDEPQNIHGFPRRPHRLASGARPD